MDDLKVYNEFIENSKSCELIIQMCFNSDFYKKQKIDLLSRLSNSNMPNKVKYCCIGSVNTEETALFHIKSREKYFRDSSEQRNLMTDDLNEFNIKNLTKFSLIFDLLCLNHQNDIKNLKVPDTDETWSNQSSFILYNCARLNAILEKFHIYHTQSNLYFLVRLLFKF